MDAAKKITEYTEVGAELIALGKDHVPTTDEFDLLTKEYINQLAIAEKVTNYAKKKLAPLIQNYIRKFGEKQKDSYMSEDKALSWEDRKWCNQGSRRSSDKPKEAIDYCTENGLDAVQVTISMSFEDYKKLYSQNKALREGSLESAQTKTVLDKDKFQKLYKAGEIPQRIINSANKTTLSYKLCSYDISEKICKSCESKIKTADNFCSKCGKKLSKTK